MSLLECVVSKPPECVLLLYTPDCLIDIRLSTWRPPIDPQLCFYLQKTTMQQHFKFTLFHYKLSHQIKDF